MRGTKTTTLLVQMPASTSKTLIIPTRSSTDYLDFRMTVSGSENEFDAHTTSMNSTLTLESGDSGELNSSVNTGANTLTAGSPNVTITKGFQLDGTYQVTMTRGAGTDIAYCLVQYRINKAN